MGAFHVRTPPNASELQGFAPGCSHAGSLIMRESGPHRTVASLAKLRLNSSCQLVARMWLRTEILAFDETRKCMCLWSARSRIMLDYVNELAIQLTALEPTCPSWHFVQIPHGISWRSCWIVKENLLFKFNCIFTYRPSTAVGLHVAPDVEWISAIARVHPVLSALGEARPL